MRTLAAILISLYVVIFSGCGGNDPPEIEEIITNETKVEPGGVIRINVVAKDEDGDALTYKYEVSAGEIEGSGSIVRWTAPIDEIGIQFIKVTVEDGENWDEESITIEVVPEDG